MKQLRILLLTTLMALICTSAVSAADFADSALRCRCGNKR